jgi:hypothetical protein
MPVPDNTMCCCAYNVQASGQQQQALRAVRGVPAGAKHTTLACSHLDAKPNQNSIKTWCVFLCVHAGKWTAATGPEGGSERASCCQAHLYHVAAACMPVLDNQSPLTIHQNRSTGPPTEEPITARK